MIYLDNAATSFPKPKCVIQGVTHFLTNIGSNPGRSANTNSIKAGKILYNTRKSLSEFIGQKDIFRTIFTLNATMALNSCLYGILEENDSVLITSLEHNSLIRPLKELEKTRKINIKIIPKFNDRCKLDHEKAKELARGCKLIAFVHANNVTGAIQPMEFFQNLAKENGSYLLVDASQSLGIYDIDMQKYDIDFLCASAHKGLYAPMGLGFFSFSKRVEIEKFKSFYQGGTGSKSEEIVQPEFLPDKYESGTINMPAIAGLEKSLEWIKDIGVQNIKNHENNMRKLLYQELKDFSNVKVCEVDNSLDTTGVLSFYFDNINISNAVKLLNDRYQIQTRFGLHCSPLTHKSIGTFENGGTIRVSPSYFTTEYEISQTIKAIKEIANG
jgi:cysteine desulfurase family protein